MIEATAREAGRPRWRPDRRAVVLLVITFAAALAVSQGCQQAQVRITKEQAVSSALQQVDFKPERTQVRLVRQGLNARPFWAVSLSVPGEDGTFEHLTTVRVDANTGKVAAVTSTPGSR